MVISACEHLGTTTASPSTGMPRVSPRVHLVRGGELESLKRVRDMVEKEEGMIMCGHDDEQFQTLKQAPDYYD